MKCRARQAGPRHVRTPQSITRRVCSEEAGSGLLSCGGPATPAQAPGRLPALLLILQELAGSTCYKPAAAAFSSLTILVLCLETQPPGLPPTGFSALLR